ncbi:bifunctional adenosylcobinamide kinase/adenosylcobinamide-phosphate guanylyltransferase [Nonomuraea sp. NPDC050328]|uniref:bifunctional adenosylcobinamide kinase/adenosylcobinamide-phosphate guanylyltransferase n=1 Tax=Nonomuraea sp. NPDC050328 TaxID=3364361 RepID=UPI0037B19E2B
MKILFTGTAGQYGWPEPGCRCASCLSLPQSAWRAPLALSVDGTPADLRRPIITGTAGDLLLNATPFADAAPAEASYAAVLVDPTTAPHVLADLRRKGLISDATHLLAAALDHRTRSEAELTRHCTLWGLQAVQDGQEVDTATPPTPRTPLPLRTLLLGGSRSGKSAEAELLLAAEPYVTYVATGPTGDDDPEWRTRVEAHRSRRPAHWTTTETTELAKTIAEATTPLLIDGIGSWLATLQWREPTRVADHCDALIEAWRRTSQPIVAVSDEVGLGVIPATASGRAFRDALGRLNQRLAAESEQVALVVAGRLLPL